MGKLLGTSKKTPKATPPSVEVVTITLPGSVSLELTQIPAGSFTMGSPSGELSHQENETQFQVQLTAGFYMGKTEVTQSQWLALMGSWPGTAPSAMNGLGNNYPAYFVSWKDAQDFVKALTTHMTKTGQGEFKVRLPTEAEWEYSCRAGTTTRFSFGDGLGANECGSAEAERVDNMWYFGNATPHFGSKEVSQKPANQFGLYDMHGNVAEWCQDAYGTYPTSPPPQVNPVLSAADSGTTLLLVNGHYWSELNVASNRVFRGGYWLSNAWDCRSAQRGNSEPAYRGEGIGFRILAAR